MGSHALCHCFKSFYNVNVDVLALHLFMFTSLSELIKLAYQKLYHSLIKMLGEVEVDPLLNLSSFYSSKKTLSLKFSLGVFWNLCTFVTF